MIEALLLLRHEDTETMNRGLRRRSGIKSATKIMTIGTLMTEVGTVIATGNEVAAEAAMDTIGKRVGPVVEIVATETDTTTTTTTTVIGIVKADVMTAGTAHARNIRVTTETTDAIAETWNTVAIRHISTVASANLIATVAATTTAAATAAAGAGLGVRGNPQGVAGSANETTAAAVARTVGAAAPAEVTVETVASTTTAAKTRLRRRLRGVDERVKEASTKPVALADGTQSAHASSKNAARPSRVTVAWHVVGELITARWCVVSFE